MNPPAIERLVALGEAPLREAVDQLSPAAALGVRHDFSNWRHDGQAAPDGDWRTWVIRGGRGFGKTRAGAEWIAAQARANPGARIALVAATREEARMIMVDGDSGLLKVAGHDLAAWRPSLHMLRWSNGAQAHLFSGASPDMLRGAQHHFAWCDELAKWEWPKETWDMLQLGLRKGALPRAVVTTTPQTGRHLEVILALADTVETYGATRANIHLSERWRDDMYKTYQGTRLEKQELEGELLPDSKYALWSAELLASCRVQVSDRASIARQHEESARDGQPALQGSDRTDGTDLLRDGSPPPRYAKLAIGVDPPVEDGTCGIVACGLTAHGIGHVLADHSVTGRSPEGWARAVVDAVAVHEATTGLSVKVIAERNQGGRMVEANLRAADAGLRIKLVHASDGKVARAAPVAHLFEGGKVKLAGRFPELEAELRQFESLRDGTTRRWRGADGKTASPDRADAMVWALTELMLGAESAEPRVRRL